MHCPRPSTSPQSRGSPGGTLEAHRRRCQPPTSQRTSAIKSQTNPTSCPGGRRLSTNVRSSGPRASLARGGQRPAAVHHTGGQRGPRACGGATSVPPRPRLPHGAPHSLPDAPALPSGRSSPLSRPVCPSDKDVALSDGGSPQPQASCSHRPQHHRPETDAITGGLLPPPCLQGGPEASAEPVSPTASGPPPAHRPRGADVPVPPLRPHPSLPLPVGLPGLTCSAAVLGNSPSRP